MEQLTDKPLLGPGQQQIAIGLKPNQVPAKELKPGDKVLLVSTPPQNTATADERAAQTTRYEATVVDWLEPDEKGPDRNTIVVYLALANRDAPAVVTLAAQSRLAVILTGAA
jgi:hypothetical protein